MQPDLIQVTKLVLFFGFMNIIASIQGVGTSERYGVLAPSSVFGRDAHRLHWDYDAEIFIRVSSN